MDNSLNNDLKSKKFSFLDLIAVFLKRKKPIMIFTLFSMVISVIVYFFILDLIFFSSSTIKSTNKSSSLFSGALESLTGGMGDLEDIGGIGGSKSSKELAAYQEIILSRRCLVKFIEKFNLMEIEEYRFLEDAVKNVREERIVMKIDKLSGLMSLGVYDKEPIVAKEMVDFLLEELNRINIEISVQNAKNNREFIETRYYKAREDLTKAEDSLKAYQFIYGIAPDLQIKAAAQSVFALEAELKAEEVKLDVIRNILSQDQPEVKLQESKVLSLRNKISDIRNSTDLNEILSLGNSPQIAMGFLRLQRDVEIQTKILAFILPIYEQAKIEEKRETPTIMILDQPYVPEKKTKPKRLTMTLIFTFIGFLFSFFIAFVWEFYEKQKELNTPEFQKFKLMMKTKNNN